MEEREPEIWKPIEGYEGLYEVSSWGRVKSLPKEWIAGNGIKRKHDGIILSPAVQKKGYLRLGLSKEGKLKSFQVHQLVAQAFIPNPNNYPLVMHLDDIPANNYYKNLKWGDDKLNAEDRDNKSRGSKTKLTEQQVLEIRNKYIPIKYSQSKLANEYNVSRALIQGIINGTRCKLALKLLE